MVLRNKSRNIAPLKIAGLYAVIGGLWILYSDRLLAENVSDSAMLSQFQTYKGWFFILATAWLLFFLVRHYLADLQQERRSLEESERYNRALFEQSPIGLGLCRMDGRIVDLNPAYAAIIGRTIQETLALNHRDITPKKYAEQEQVQLNSLRESGRYGPYEKEYIHKDGHLVPVRLQGLLIDLGGVQCIWSSVEDITERKRTELILASEKQVLEMVTQGAALPEVLEKIVLNIEALSQDTIASILLLDADGLHVHYGAAPNLPEAYNRALEGAAIGPHAGSCGTAAYLREPVIVTDIETDPLWADYRELALTYGLRACWSTPIMSAEGKVLGTFAMYYSDSRSPGEEDLKLIARATHLAGIAIERKKSEEELLTINEELLSINRIITTTTTTTTGVKEILEKVMDEALNITGLEGGTICMVTSDNSLHLAAHRETSEATIQDLTTNEVKIGDCLCGECAKDQKPLILPDREAVLKFSTREATRGEDIRFHAAFPINFGDRCLGVLCVFTRTDKKPAERRLKLLETVTSQIAIAVDNAQMFQEISHNAAMLEDRVNDRTAELKDSQSALMSIVEDLNQKSEELRVANEQLKEIDRLKSIFIASMSHELRTPLNSIIGFSSILQNEWLGPLSKEQKENLQTILRAGKHLLNLINDVIDVSKIEAGKVESIAEDFDLHGLVMEAVDLVKKEASEKGLEFLVESTHVEMHTDRRRLMQCIVNLLSNAVKFTEKGSVRVSAQRVKGQVTRVKDKENTVKCQGEEGVPLLLATCPLPLNKDFVEISVEDTGIGIRDEAIPKLFNSFIRLDSPLKATVPGTGLGLYITKKIISELLKGNILVSSRHGEGSRFTLLVPTIRG